MSVRASLAPLQRPQLRRLLTAQFVAELADGIVTVALPLYVYARTGSASATSWTFVVEIVAGLVLSVVGGVLADRNNRRVVLLVSYVIRGCLLPVAAAASPMWMAIGCGVLARAMGMLDNPSFEALVPGLAEGDLQQVVGARRFAQSASLLVGPGAGGVLVSLIGARPTLALAGVLFLVPLARIATMAELDATHDQRRAIQGPTGFRSAVSSMTDGVRLIVHHRVLRRLMIYWSLTMATVAMVIVVAIVWLDQDLDVSDAWYGLSIGAYGTGNMIGLLWAGGRRFKLSLAAIEVRAIPVYAMVAALAVAWHTPWLMLVSWFAWGAAMGPELVVGDTVVVRAVPEELRGRASAAQAIFLQLGMAGGYAVAGSLVDTIGARSTNTVVAVMTLALVTMWIGPYRREQRALAAG